MTKLIVINGENKNYDYIYDDNSVLIELVLNGKLSETYSYDDNDNLIKIERENVVYLNEYNKDNQLIKTVTTYPDEDQYIIEYTYNDGGDILKTYSTKGNTSTSCEYDYQLYKKIINCDYSGEMKTKDIYYYDDNENIIKEENYKNESKEYTKINNIENNLIMSSDISFPDSDFKVKLRYEYDQNGNILSVFQKLNEEEETLIEENTYK